MSALLNLQIDIIGPFKKVFQDLAETLPTVVFFILFVIICWLIIKIVLWVVRKALAKTSIDQLSEKLSETKIFGDTTINVVLTGLIVGVLKWFLILIFVMAGSGIFGLTAVSDGLSAFFAYLPRLVIALIIFGAGVYLGTLVKNAILGMFKSLEISGGNVVANIAFYLIVIFLSITALDQAGIDTTIIKSNLTLIIASVLAAFTLAFGLGSRTSVERLLFGYYSRKNIEIGQRIKTNDIEGVVVSIDNICMVLSTDNGKVIFPIKDIADSKIEILN